MASVDDLIADWEQMRSTLKKQLDLLESRKMRTGVQIIGAATTKTIEHMKYFLAELETVIAKASR
jgi:hypothetical protein